MTASRTRAWIAAGLTVLVPCLTPITARAQESGTLLSQTLTLKKGAANPSMDFKVTGGPNGKDANTTTKIYLEFGADGNVTTPPPDPLPPNTAQFKLTKTGGANPTFTFTQAGGSDAVTFAPKIAALSKGLEDPANPAGLYVLSIVHLAPNGSPPGTKGVPANTTETWKLELLNVPANLRAVATIDQGTFAGLVPTGVCAGASQPCPGVCGPGESCQPWKFRLRELFYIVELKWPPIPPECLRCPGPWKGPVPDGFDRSLVSVFPITQAGDLLGPGKSGEISMNIRGGEPVGELFDAGGGQYYQLVQFRKGTSATVSATAAGVTSAEVVAGPPEGGGSRRLSLVLGVLLVLALIVIGYLLTQRGRTNVARA